MLQQSQGQYMALDKKYNKAKRLVREYQQRELDMCHREEFYQQLLQEKDTEYNALVKKLKDRVINLEHELQETQRKAGFPVGLPYDSATLKLTPQMMRKAPPKPLFHKLETELSDTEISDLSPDGDGVKTATVERKVPVKDELDAAVPQHELLDNSVNKTKIDLGKYPPLLIFSPQFSCDHFVERPSGSIRGMWPQRRPDQKLQIMAPCSLLRLLP